jgi:hypothetical protein
MSEYLELIEQTGFSGIEVLKSDKSYPAADDWQSSLINLTLRAHKAG